MIFNNRLLVLQLTFYLFFAILVLRLLQIQVIRHDYFASLAWEQHLQYEKIPGQRGDVFSSDGFSLATNEITYKVIANPHQVKDPKSTAEALSPLLWSFSQKQEEEFNKISESNKDFLFKTLTPTPENIEDKQRLFHQAIAAELKKSDLYWTALATKVDSETKEKIKALNFKGIYFEQEIKRIYPEKTLAAHVLGFVGKSKSGEDVGYAGVEGAYNGDIAGRDGLEAIERDATGDPIPIAQRLVYPAVKGRQVFLTIRRDLQYSLEKLLAEGVEKYKAQGGSFILMDPKNGQILAMANYPNFSPEYWQKYLGLESGVSKISIFVNKAIADNYEPGSVLKPFTMATALENKVVTPQTTYNDQGPLTVSGHLIRTWDNKYHGTIDIARILQLSDNTGAAWVGLKIGLGPFLSFLNKFGFGKPTGVDLLGEDRGIVKERNNWRDIDLATAAFGQGIAVTPLQLAQFYAAVANNGILMKPFIVNGIKEENRLIEIKPQTVGQPISSNVAKTIREMLRLVIDKGEFTWFVKKEGLEKWDLAGKTGTAQIPVNGKYDPNQTKVTFVGMAPASDPKFVLLVMLDRPSTSTFSADTAVPLWLKMVKELLIYFQIPPRF